MGTAVAAHAEHVRTVLEQPMASGAPLVASWRRCARLHQLDPAEVPTLGRYSEAELRDLAGPMEPMLQVATPTLERLRRGVGAQGVCLLVSNAGGVPLYWAGPASDEKDLRERGLCRGVDWSEARSGTNGIGTSLVEKRALVVRRRQHYFVRPLDITCAAAPFYDHEGRPAGAVNVTFYGAASEHAPAGLLLASVAEAARQIEIDHFHHVFRRARILSLPGPARAGAALLATDRDDIVLGASRAARQLLGLSCEALRDGVVAGDLLADLGAEGEEAEEGFDRAECGVLRRALLRDHGNVSAAARRLGISHATIKRRIRHHRLDRRALT